MFNSASISYAASCDLNNASCTSSGWWLRKSGCSLWFRELLLDGWSWKNCMFRLYSLGYLWSSSMLTGSRMQARVEYRVYKIDGNNSANDDKFIDRMMNAWTIFWGMTTKESSVLLKCRSLLKVALWATRLWRWEILLHLMTMHVEKLERIWQFTSSLSLPSHLLAHNE